MHFYQFGEWEFYDLDRDPDELTNAFGDPSYQVVVADLKVQLADLGRLYADDTDMSEMSDEWKANPRRNHRR